MPESAGAAVPAQASLGKLIAQRTGQAATGIPLGYLPRPHRAFDAEHPRLIAGQAPPRRYLAWLIS
jgi:hypothetical protein